MDDFVVRIEQKLSLETAVIEEPGMATVYGNSNRTCLSIDAFNIASI